jgi:hypothetical protein
MGIVQFVGMMAAWYFSTYSLIIRLAENLGALLFTPLAEGHGFSRG